MRFRTRFSDGNLTNGEANVLVATVADCKPEDIEAFIVLTYKHVEDNFHELILTSSLGQDRAKIDSFLFLAHRSTMDRIYRYPPQIRLRGNRFSFPWIRRHQ